MTRQGADSAGTRTTTFWKSKDLVLLIPLVLASRLFLNFSTSYTMDDAFITYRYARNIVSGEGFVYNPGEKVEGTSTPLFTLLLALSGGVFGSSSIPVMSRTLALIADTVSLLILWRILSALGATGRFLVCVLFAMYPKVVLVSISGMETPLVILLMLASYLMFTMKKVRWASVLLGLLVLCRFDGAIWSVVCVGFAGWQLLKSSLSAALLGMSIPAGWLVFSKTYFGSWIPNSVLAKMASYSHEFPWFDPVRVLLGYYPFEGLKGQSFLLQVAAVIVLLLPIGVELVRLIRIRSPLVLFPVFFLVYNLVFSLGRTIVVDWYYLPGYVAYFVTLGTLVDRMKSWSQDNARRCLKIVAVGLLALLLGVGSHRWVNSLTNLYEHENIALGKWLRIHAKQSARIFVEPIGYVGWISNLYIHDYVGLVSPAVIDFRRRYSGSDAWFLEYIREKLPDYIVLRDWEIPSNRLFHGRGDGIFQGTSDRGWFAANYRLIDWNRGNHWNGPGPLALYQRSVGIVSRESDGSAKERR